MARVMTTVMYVALENFKDRQVSRTYLCMSVNG